MNINEAKKILQDEMNLEGSGLGCILNPNYNSENSGGACSIKNINRGWIDIAIGRDRMNVRAKDLETIRTAHKIGWR